MDLFLHDSGTSLSRSVGAHGSQGKMIAHHSEVTVNEMFYCVIIFKDLAFSKLYYLQNPIMNGTLKLKSAVTCCVSYFNVVPSAKGNKHHHLPVFLRNS